MTADTTAVALPTASLRSQPTHNHPPILPADRPIVAVLGAGVSMLPPACLPSWSGMQRHLLAALHDRLPAPIPRERAADWQRRILERQARGRMPAEYLAEIVARRLPDRYFELLQVLDGDRPTPVHRRLASLAGEGRLAAIVTTNFDRLTEAAFREAGVPLRVCIPATAPTVGAGPVLLKVHGCASDPSTIVDTLAQRKRGLPAEWIAALRSLRADHPWLVLGSSGADLDANGAFLQMRSTADASPGLAWLTMPGEPVRASVADLLAAHADRGRVVEGRLPGWFDSVADAPAGSVSAPDASPVDVGAVAADWAASIDPCHAATVLADVLHRCGEPEEAADLLLAVEPIAAAASADDGATHASVLASLAQIHRARSNIDAALRYSAAELAIWRGLGDAAGVARAMTMQAGLLETRGDYEGARSAYRESLRIKRAHGDRAGEAIALVGLSAVDRRQGNYDAARQSLHRVLAIKADLGDEPGRGFTLNSLATLARQQGLFAEAVDRYAEAAAVFDRLGDDFSLAMTMTGRAIIHRRTGDLAAARSAYEGARSLKQRLGDRRGIAACHLGLATTARAAGDPESAHRDAESALSIYEAIGDRQGAAMVANVVAGLWQDAGEHREAAAWYARSLADKRAIGDRHGIAMTLGGMAELHRATGDLLAARRVLRQAIRIKRELGDDRGCRESLDAFAAILAVQGRTAAADRVRRRAGGA